jgi:glycosidase
MKASRPTEALPHLRWWQRAVVYEITPISFQDSNGDGKGDLPGLMSRIDYLEWLGGDAVWLTPISNRACTFPLNFALLDSPWDVLSLQANIDAYYNAIAKDAWPDWVIGAHDKSRVAGKIGEAQARILAMLIMTLRGTPFLFAGDELGIEPVAIPPNRVQDPFERLVGGYGPSRDPERSPMRWDDSENGGFTSGEP